MSAPPSVVSPVADPADIELDPAAADAPMTADPEAARPDPAASVVAIGDVPALVKPRRARRTVLPPMPTDRARGWIVTAIITAIGAAVRLVGLGNSTDGGTPLFDEKYYAIQAQEILRNGGVEDNQGFGVVVHPPFGKQLIAIGEWLLGYTPTGWRLASAVAGIVSILLIIRVVRRMTRSTLLGRHRRRADDLRRRQPRPVPLRAAGHLPGGVRPRCVCLHGRRPGPGSRPAGSCGGGRIDRHQLGRGRAWAPVGGGSVSGCCSA